METALIGALLLSLGFYASRNKNGIEDQPEQFMDYRQMDYSEKKLPLEFREHGGPMPGLYRNSQDPEAPTSGGLTTSSHQGTQISLTGEPIDADKFVHNNMLPFFGGRITQNVDEYAHRTRLETFTGNEDNYQRKREVAPFFKPQTNMSNVYGMSNMYGYYKNRYIPSVQRNNESPVDAVRVGPGLNQGYTATPSGGFQQANARDYTLPKTVDELRTKDNPKLSYQGRVITGNRSLTRGTIGVVQKNNPDSFWINSPDRWFTTTGAVIREKQRPDIVLRDGSRKDTGSTNYFAGAGPGERQQHSEAPQVQESRRHQNSGPGFRNAGRGDGWSIPVDPSRTAEPPHDYGRSGARAGATERATTGSRTHISNATMTEGGRGAARTTEPLQINRQNIDTDGRWVGNTDPGYSRPYIRDPEQRARTTMRQTTEDKTRQGIAEMPAQGGYQVANPYVPTTTKETTLAGYSGNPGQGLDGAYQDAEYEVPITSRQMTTRDYTGGAGNAGAGTDQAASRDAAYASVVRSVRDIVSQGRAPAEQGSKVAIGADMINARTRRDIDTQYKSLDERGGAAAQRPNQMLPLTACNLTRDKKTVDNEPLDSRLDPATLSAFRENPYTQSLHSATYR